MSPANICFERGVKSLSSNAKSTTGEAAKEKVPIQCDTGAVPFVWNGYGLCVYLFA